MRSMTVYNFLLESALWGSALILAVLLVRAALRRGIGSKAVYAAWLLVAARLLVPLSLPNPHMNELGPTLSTDAAARPIADQLRTRFIDGLEDIADVLYPKEQAESSIIRRFAEDTDRGRTGNAALMLYACGSFIVAAVIICRNVSYRRRMRRNRVGALDGEALRMYHSLCERLKLKPIPAYYADRLSDARLVGVFKPFIVVPLDLPPSRIRLALIQQLCHLRARDGIWALMRCVCLTVHWMNIFVWLAAWYSRVDCELACDERVTALLDEPLQYSNELAVNRSGPKWSMLLLSTGVMLNSAQHRRRVSAAIRPRREKRWKRALCAILGVVAIAAAFATGESYELPSVGEPPEAVWEASLAPLSSADEAIAHSRRFLESPFIGERTADMRIDAIEREDGWLLYASKPEHAMPVTLWLDREGRVLMYENYRTVGKIPVGVLQYAHRSPLESVRAYIEAFFRASLPDTEYRAGHITNDVTAEDMRYINLEAARTPEHSGYLLTLQTEPEARVLAYLGTSKPVPRDARCPQDAQRIATFDLTEIYDLSHRQIDAGGFFTEYDDVGGGWRVRFERKANGEDSSSAPLRFEWLISRQGDVLERSGRIE